MLSDSLFDEQIQNIFELSKQGLDFLKMSDEIDFEKKIRDSNLNFLTENEVIAISKKIDHTQNLLVRPALLQSAIARPLNLFLYQDNASIPYLASELCFGIVQNHPFFDGNKRISLIALNYFLVKNNYPMPNDSLRLANLILDLANHKKTTFDLSDYIIANLEQRNDLVL